MSSILLRGQQRSLVFLPRNWHSRSVVSLPSGGLVLHSWLGTPPTLTPSGRTRQPGPLTTPGTRRLWIARRRPCSALLTRWRRARTLPPRRFVLFSVSW